MTVALNPLQFMNSSSRAPNPSYYAFEWILKIATNFARVNFEGKVFLCKTVTLSNDSEDCCQNLPVIASKYHIIKQCTTGGTI